MTYFLFAGDMLVMLFMVVIATWVFVWSSDRDIKETAAIPLNDEVLDENDDAV